MNNHWTKDEIALTRYAWRLRDRMEQRRKLRNIQYMIAALGGVGIACTIVAPGEALIVLLALPVVSWLMSRTL